MARTLTSLLLSLAALAVVRGARADETSVCIDASARGQEQRDKGKLRDARESFLACSRPVCHRLIRADCAGWLADVEARTPSVVLSAQDPAGRDVADVRVSLDGRPLSERLGAQAIAIDPGEHVLRFERTGSPAVTQSVILREGEKRRVISVRFAVPPPTPVAEPSSVPVAPIVLGAVALAGGGAFIGLALSAKGDVERMRRECAPGCPEGDVTAARAKLIAGNVSLGVGIAALVGAGVVLIAGSRTAPKPVALTLSLYPAIGGGVATLGGRF